MATDLTLRLSPRHAINSSTAMGTLEKLRVNTPAAVDNSAEAVIAASTTGSRPLVVQGMPGQTADLQQWQSSTGTALARLLASGSLLFATGLGISTDFVTDIASTGAYIQTNAGATGVMIRTRADGNKGLLIRANSPTHSANLQEWQNSGVVLMAYVSAGGRIYAPVAGITAGTTTNATSSSNTIAATVATDIALVVKGFASQAAKLQDWQNSAGTSLGSVSALGAATFAGITAPQTVPMTAKSAAYTATTADQLITGDATSAAFSITLPTAVGATGKIYEVKRINSGTNNVTVATTSSQTIDGLSSWILTTQYEAVRVVSDGANWVVI